MNLHRRLSTARQICSLLALILVRGELLGLGTSEPKLRARAPRDDKNYHSLLRAAIARAGGEGEGEE